MSRVVTQGIRQLDLMCCITSGDSVDVGLSEYVSLYFPRRDGWACEGGVCLSGVVEGSGFVLWCLHVARK